MATEENKGIELEEMAKNFYEWKNYNASYFAYFLLLKELGKKLMKKEGNVLKFLKENFNVNVEEIYEKELRIIERRDVKKEDVDKLISIIKEIKSKI